jgi:hypothetical protein
MVLPFLVHQLVGDEGERLPGPLRGEAASGDQHVQVRIEVPGTAGGLQDHDAADLQRDTSGGLEDVP